MKQALGNVCINSYCMPTSKEPFPTSTLILKINLKNHISLNNERTRMIQSTVTQQLIYS